MPNEQAERLLAAFVPSGSGVQIKKCSASVRWLFLWNLYAFWVARRWAQPTRFADLYDPMTWERIIGRLQVLAGQARKNEQKLNVLALAGLLGYFSNDLAPRLRGALVRRITGFRWLTLKTSEEQPSSFPSALASIGLAFIGPPHLVFSSERISRLTAKTKDCKECGPGLEDLCAFFGRAVRTTSSR